MPTLALLRSGRGPSPLSLLATLLVFSGLFAMLRDRKPTTSGPDQAHEACDEIYDPLCVSELDGGSAGFRGRRIRSNGPRDLPPSSGTYLFGGFCPPPPVDAGAIVGGSSRRRTNHRKRVPNVSQEPAKSSGSVSPGRRRASKIAIPKATFAISGACVVSPTNTATSLSAQDYKTMGALYALEDGTTILR
jgi:hypothetical protein